MTKAKDSTIAEAQEAAPEAVAEAPEAPAEVAEAQAPEAPAEPEAPEEPTDLDAKAAAGDEAAQDLVYRIEINKSTGDLKGVPKDDKADAAAVVARRDGTIKSGVTGA